jgi:hypothetical protein
MIGARCGFNRSQRRSDYSRFVKYSDRRHDKLRVIAEIHFETHANHLVRGQIGNIDLPKSREYFSEPYQPAVRADARRRLGLRAAIAFRYS